MRNASGYHFPFAESTSAVVVDGTCTLLAWTAEAEALLRLPGDEVCGRPVRNLLADPDRWPEVLAQQTETAWEGRVTLRQGGGLQVPVAYRVLPLDTLNAEQPREGEARYLVVGAPSAQVSTWRQDRAFTRGLFLQERVGLAVFDEDLRLVRTNSHLMPYTGVPADLSGRRLAEFLYAEDAQGIEEQLTRVLRTGKPAVGEEHRVRTLVDPRGGRVLAITAFRLQEPDRHILGVTAVFTDVTDHHRARRRLDLVHRATAALGGSLSVTRTSEELAGVLVPALADTAAVDIAEAVFSGEEPPTGDQRQPALHRTAVAGADAAPTAGTPPAGAPLTAMSAPLRARGILLGAVTVWRSPGSAEFDTDDRTVLEQVASRAALAVDNARHYTREHRAAVSLQHSLLPPAMSDSVAVQSSSVYLPTGTASGVGGDWFDVIQLSSARVALVVGDVVGHGLRAIAMMGRLRMAVRTLADLDLEPEELLVHLDDLVSHLVVEAESSDPESGQGEPHGALDVIGATCLYALYDPVTRRCAMASAGHPPPALVHPDGTVAYAEVNPGPPLGVGGLPFEPAEVELAQGSVLALYTDGLIKGGAGDVDEGMRELEARLLRADVLHRPLQDAGRDVVEGLPPRRLPDDVTLLLARTRVVPPRDTVTWSLNADPAVVSEARELVAHQLAVWGLEQLAFTTVLVVSELLTNAIRYGVRGGDERVDLRLVRAGALTCEVSDPSSTQPRMRRAAVTEEGGRGLYLVAQLTNRWGSRYTRQGKTIWAEQPLPEPLRG
ncbi:SpoIIE family protein phosphatase [Streptomyces sp. KR80]|uniref:SpoIIE family protein phosphatase n=1 Tax=Streptomyces sp. KR80 TaxID=3457426 RepID=UPI003FD467F6